MPHFPKAAATGRLAAMSMPIPAEIAGTQEPRSNKPPLPGVQRRSSRNPFMGRLSVKRFSVPPDDVYAFLFKSPQVVDPLTGVTRNVPGLTK